MKFTQHNCYFAMSIWKCMAYFVKKKKPFNFRKMSPKVKKLYSSLRSKNHILNILVNDNIKSRYLIWCTRIVSVMIQQVPSKSK